MLFCNPDLKLIPGIAEKTEQALFRLNITRSFDLLFHFPTQVINKKLYPPIFTIKEGDQVILKLKILDMDQPNNPYHRKNKSFTIYCINETGRINLCYFNYFPNYLLNWAKKDSEIIAIGKVDFFHKFKQIAHPEVLNPANPNLKLPQHETIYPLTYGLVNKQIQKYVQYMLSSLDGLDEWIPSEIISKHNWPSFKSALVKIHHPKKVADINPFTPERQRIAFDELLATQLIVNLMRKYKSQDKGRMIRSSGKFYNLFRERLPFKLTNGQIKAIEEIFSRSSIKP
jgi:ATP-dependent DNA helicase RecG